MKCSKCLEDKLISKDKNWCKDCKFAYQMEEFKRMWNEWVQQHNNQEIDKLLEKYYKHHHMTWTKPKGAKDGGWLDIEPGYDCSKTDDMSPYEFYDYTRLVEQWNMTDKYVCSHNMFNIMSSCDNCGSKCSPETRTIIDKNKWSFTCTNCKEIHEMNGILQCECTNVCADYRKNKFNIIRQQNNNDTDKIDKLDIIGRKFIGSHLDDCMYACTDEDRRDLLVLPDHERIIFGRGLTRTDIENHKPELCKYYDPDDYFLSYVYICLNCKKNQAFRADHVAFEIGDVFDCPHCNHPLTYFKVSKKGPFKVPSQYQFILD